MNQLATQENAAAQTMEEVLIVGNLSELTAEERVDYYGKLCRSLGLNPLSKPFEYLELPAPGGAKKLVLYAKKDCTDQLRGIHKVSIQIVSREMAGDLYIVTARATMPDGRTDESIGALPLSKEGGEWKTNQSGKRFFEANGKMVQLSPEDRANAVMKCETKAKRRVTLSICGLGFTDESEVDTIPSTPAAPSQRPTDTTPKQLEPPKAQERAVPGSMRIIVERIKSEPTRENITEALRIMRDQMAKHDLGEEYTQIKTKYKLAQGGFSTADVIDALLDMRSAIDDQIKLKAEVAGAEDKSDWVPDFDADPVPTADKHLAAAKELLKKESVPVGG